MSTGEDYYEILGLSRDATSEEIKKVYRKLAKKYHPDANKEDPKTEEKFKKIAEAYSILINPEKRQQYDYFGKVDSGLSGFGGSDFFQDVFSTFDTFFGNFYGSRKTRMTQDGSDVLFDLKVSFKEAALGGEKEVEFDVSEKCGSCQGSGVRSGTYSSRCRECNGTGSVKITQKMFLGSFTQIHTCNVCGGTGEVIDFPCTDCQGTGRKKVTKKLSISIPPGVDNGNYLRVPGCGEAGLRGGSPGDLIIRILVEPHGFFKRSGDDILCEVSTSFTQLALGAELEIPTLNGNDKLKIPTGTQPGTVFRLKGKGILKNSHRGDQLIKINVEVPTNLTREEKELLIKFARTRGESVNKS